MEKIIVLNFNNNLSLANAIESAEKKKKFGMDKQTILQIASIFLYLFFLFIVIEHPFR